MIDNLQPSSYLREIDQHYSEIIIPPILPWPCSRSQLLPVLKTSCPRKFKLSTSPQSSCIHISHVSKMTRPLTRKLKRKKRANVAWNTSGLETTLVPSQPPMTISLTLPARLVRAWVIPLISTAIRRVITR